MAQPDRGSSPQTLRDDRGRDELDDYVLAFEEAYLDRGSADPKAFLPPSDHPLHRAVLRELVRVDLEFGWDAGRPKSLDDYRHTFPELANDPDALGEIAYEEYRLRRAAGQSPSADEYRRRYGVTFEAHSSQAGSATRLRIAACRDRPDDDGDDDPDGPGPGGRALRGDERPPGRPQARRPSGAATPRLPEPGERFLDFQLLRELGRGSFGQVYLAEQVPLAGRSVVLKVTADRHDESQTLAQLQHDYIVPIYSQHGAGGLHAVCMPYLGTVTLRDVLVDLKARNAPPGSGRDLISSLAKSSRRKGVRGSAERADGPGRAAAEPDARGGVGTPAAAAAATAVPLAAPAPDAPRSLSLSAVSSRLGRLWMRRPTSADGAPTVVGSGTAVAPPPAVATPPSPAPRPWESLARLSYVEAVVWMAARVARGLAHAHDRGILHRDLKPANILLADDGRPLLLDFNLAADVKRTAAGGESTPGGLGGTLPYMAPEHLEAFLRGGREAEVAVDARSDVYALGVILYEMFTGHLPFPSREVVAGDRQVLRAMIADRASGAPPVRPYNPAVSPGVESIVRHCLEPDPARRYPSAAALADDLERHLAHAPLAHAPEPACIERAAKWARRHRGTLLGAVALAGLAALVLLAAAIRNRAAADEALAALGRFERRATEARTRLGQVKLSPMQERQAVDAANQALDEFRVRDEAPASWWARPPASLLPAARRARVRAEAGTLLLLLARNDARRGRPDAALQASRRAEAAFGPDAAPRSLWLQRAELLRAAGLPAGAEVVARSEVARSAEPSAFDLMLEGQDLLSTSPREALDRFDRALALDRTDLWTWLSKGQALWDAGDDRGADACFDACLLLDPNHPAAWFNRGLVELKRGRPREAAVAFDNALKARPDDPEALFNRAIADLRQGRLADAELGLGQALARGASPTLVHLARYRVRIARHDLAGARHDLDEALRRTPGDDPNEWVARAGVLADRDDRIRALADLDHALLLDPTHRYALHNKAANLTKLKRLDEAAAVLDRVVELRPYDYDARIDRAVVLGRLGRRDAAVADVDNVLRASHLPPPAHLIRAASALAQTSRSHRADRARALELLGVVVRRDAVPPDVLENDPDFEPIRDDRAFGRLLADARSSSRDRSRRDAAEGPASRPPAGGSTTDLPGSPTTKGSAP